MPNLAILGVIVDPRLMQKLPKHFNSLGTIEAESVIQDPYSGEESIVYTASLTMTNILCYVEPTSPTKEVRRPDNTIVETAWDICLKGYYPLIDVEDRIKIDGVYNHNILAVKHDDTHTVTFLTTEIIT